jgi:uncharacterized protein YbaR (Trm112 family)/SAM-dependent methyltransferase
MTPPRNLYDLLVCPVCKHDVDRREDHLHCVACGRAYPIVNGVPVMFPDGSVPTIQHEQELSAVGNYFPWINRLVLQSLLDDQVVLEIGAGNMALDDPCVIRMDIVLTPHVDIVADAHALPFRSGAFDFQFSLAVFEHLRQPFAAAEEIRRVLKDGGYAYNECAWVFAYHGYPHNYFNASLQGLEQVFANFRKLRTGIAPYQMPSFALQMVLLTYLRHSTIGQYPEARPFLELLQQVVADDLVAYDRYFTEQDAAYVAACGFFFGLKQDTPESTIIPAAVREAWAKSAELHSRFPEPLNLGTVQNLLRWAREDGRDDPAVAAYLDSIVRFNKRGADRPFERSVIRNAPYVEPRFGVLYDYPDAAPAPRRTLKRGSILRLQTMLRAAANRLDRLCVVPPGEMSSSHSSAWPDRAGSMSWILPRRLASSVKSCLSRLRRGKDARHP